MYTLRSKWYLFRRILKSDGLLVLCFNDKGCAMDEYNPKNLSSVKNVGKWLRRHMTRSIIDETDRV